MENDTFEKLERKKISSLEEAISMLKKKLKFHEEKAEKYFQLFEKESNAIIIFDSETFEIEEVNEASVAMMGYSGEEFLSLKAHDLLTQKEKIPELIQSAMEKNSGQNPIFYHRIIAKSGKVFSGSIYASSFVLDGRKKIYWGIRDISEELNTEKKLQESREQLFQAQKMEALGTLAAGAAHEINNPVNMIMNNIVLIKRIWKDVEPLLAEKEKVSPNQKYGGLPYAFLYENLGKMIEDMDLGAKRIESIVCRMKDFARKSDIIQKSGISINDAVNNAVRLSGTTIKKAKVETHLNLSDDIPNIYGHLQSLEQVLLNLIINAIEAIEHENGRIDLNTSYDKSGDMAVITVEDNGKGMDSETRKKIFDPFFTTKTTQGGTGLGLSVSYSLVKEHNGTLTCESEKNRGTVFSIQIPIKTDEKPVKVLIADDDPGVRKALAMLVKKAGFNAIEQAGSGTETLIKLGVYRPDLLILDLFMPQMNGLEVCRNIMKEKLLSKMKVIIVTGIAESDELREIKKLGFQNIFIKPVETKEFIRAVASIFE